MYLSIKQHDQFRTLLMGFEIPFRGYIADVLMTHYSSANDLETALLAKNASLTPADPFFLRDVLPNSVKHSKIEKMYNTFSTASLTTEIVAVDQDMPMVGALNIITFALTGNFNDLYSLFTDYSTFCDLAEKYRSWIFAKSKNYQPLSSGSLNALKDQAINSSKNGDWETGLKILDAQQEVMRKLIDKGHDLAVSMIFSEVNRAYALENLKRQEEAVRSWRRAYEMKTEFSENGDTRKPLGIAAYHVAEAEKDRKQASALYMEAASLLEPHCDFRPAAIMYFLSCLHYAYSIDEVESEKAVGIYRKALSTMRRYHLDENQNLRIAIATTCNNLAWVLWNRLNSEEAAVYYGMALDMLEEWLTDPEMESEPVKGQISHIGTALYHFYIDTNKFKEAERIKARLEAADAPMRDVDND